MMITCDVCKRGVEAGALYRANPLGELPGIFRHEACGGKPADKETKEIAELIQNDGKKEKSDGQ